MEIFLTLTNVVMSQGGLDIQSMLFRAVHFSDRLDKVVEDSIFHHIDPHIRKAKKC